MERISHKEKMNSKREIIDENNTKTTDNYIINFIEHVKEEDFEIKINHLDERQQSEINSSVSTFESVLTKNKYDGGISDGYEARIDLLVDKYCSKRPYRCTLEDKKETE
ncbi:hypothetical protein EVAR_57219_1 [Eumeta japonica]|uniref:Uncharacterized protein n=1 Tax=Eumeta variegata TaxID=151549 RepID=A0A4C1YGH8_EUMVA|nr:hypothetical protein EVAR_57219_1 [Eumeta japonica]